MEMLEILAKIVVVIVLVPIALYLLIKVLPLLSIIPGIILYLNGYPWIGALVTIVCFLISGFLYGMVVNDPVDVRIKKW